MDDIRFHVEKREVDPNVDMFAVRKGKTLTKSPTSISAWASAQEAAGF